MISTVVIATTKVRIFKQITTPCRRNCFNCWLLLLPQRYVFSSKSQLIIKNILKYSCCYCYHKGTYFQANHNSVSCGSGQSRVVIATTKVRIFKQITTIFYTIFFAILLLLLPQRYVFSSKSQH